MDQEPYMAIELRGVSKIYNIYPRSSDRIKELLHPYKKKYHKVFHALDDIDLSIKKGESYGIIGKNGSGKSTLLQIIAGVISPTSGKVNIQGRVASLLELGVGFDPESTGIENISMYFAINGIGRNEVARKLDEVVQFADIGYFINQPVKLYSSGMFVRLAFACATHVNPDIFIVDEALAVGDLSFTQKCFRRLRDFVEGGGTLLFVSHDMTTVKSIASKAVWLDQGKIREQGSVREITDHYIGYMNYGDKHNIICNDFVSEHGDAGGVSNELWDQVKASNYTIFNGAEALGVSLVAVDNITSNKAVFNGDEVVEYAMKIRFGVAVENIMVGVALLNGKAATIFHYNTEIYSQAMPQINIGDVYILRLRLKLPNLARGKYNFYTNIVDGDFEQNDSVCMLNGVCEFEVNPKGKLGKLNGLLYIETPEFKADLFSE